jgi:hypothetical protein
MIIERPDSEDDVSAPRTVLGDTSESFYHPGDSFVITVGN